MVGALSVDTVRADGGRAFRDYFVHVLPDWLFSSRRILHEGLEQFYASAVFRIFNTNWSESVRVGSNRSSIRSTGGVLSFAAAREVTFERLERLQLSTVSTLGNKIDSATIGFRGTEQTALIGPIHQWASPLSSLRVFDMRIEFGLCSLGNMDDIGLPQFELGLFDRLPKT